MSDLATIGGVVAAVSACTSGICAAVAYHVPTRLRDGMNIVGEALLQIDDTEVGHPPATPEGDRHQH